MRQFPVLEHPLIDEKRARGEYEKLYNELYRVLSHEGHQLRNKSYRDYMIHKAMIYL